MARLGLWQGRVQKEDKVNTTLNKNQVELEAELKIEVDTQLRHL